MKKRNFLAVITFCFCWGFGIFNASASEIDNRIVNYGGKETKFSTIKSELCKTDIGTVVFEDPINVDGVNIELLCTFADREKAAMELEERYSKTFDFLHKNSDLPEKISVDNWKEFYDATKIDKTDLDDEIIYGLVSIRAFFDIYENNEVNDQIKALANSNTYHPLFKSSLNDETKLQLELLIPDYSDNFGILNSIQKEREQQKILYAYNKTKGVDYANSYATKPNTYEYYYFKNGDCANFVSQIIHYGGKNQVISNNTKTGWWHKKSGTTHTHSLSWTVADTFAKYMGVQYYSTDLYAWSKKITVGDPIALDSNNDGVYEHIGYITGISNDYKSQEYENNGVCGIIHYNDFKVAQHTDNYNAWASTSTNGWELAVRDGARYAIIKVS